MLEIAQKDERNVAIANCAKGKAFDMMTFLFGALFIALQPCRWRCRCC